MRLDFQVFRPEGLVTARGMERLRFALRLQVLDTHYHELGGLYDRLREARRITAKGGHLCLEVPHPDGLPARVFGARWSQIDAPRHLSYFTRATLADMLQRCGYRLVHTETFQIPLLLGFSVMQAFGATRMGRMGLFDGILAGLASLPFLLAYPVMDEFMYAVAEAE